MGKIYYGNRGSGKTIKLLRQAEALTDEGLTPVIICCHKDFIDTLKWKAEQAHINISGVKFLTYKESIGNPLLKDEKSRVLIDELEIFVRDILESSREIGFYATLSAEEADIVRLSREDWDK